MIYNQPELLKAEPLSKKELAAITLPTFVVITSVPHENRKGYKTALFTDVNKALDYAGKEKNLECVYNITADRLIHLEHPEKGLTDDLKTMIIVAQREAYEVQTNWVNALNIPDGWKEVSALKSSHKITLNDVFREPFRVNITNPSEFLFGMAIGAFGIILIYTIILFLAF